MPDKTLNVPVDSYVERLLLGSILVSSGESMDAMRSALEPGDFGLEKHRRLWEAMRSLYDETGKLDRVILCRELQRRGELEACGGLTYLAFLEEGMPNYPCLDQYIDKLKDTALIRRMQVMLDNLAKRAAAEIETGSELLEAMHSMTDSMYVRADGRGPVSTKDLVDQYGIDELLNPKAVEGVRLPWHRLNEALHGFRGGQSIVLAADTGRGKTSLACQIATHVTRQGKSVLYWTLEMPPQALFQRMVNQITGVDRRHAKATFESRTEERDAVCWFYENPIYFDERSRTIPEFCASIRKVAKEVVLGLIVVDYLGLIHASGRAESRTREVGDNSRSLKLAAMDFGLPFLTLSQYRRPKEGEKPTIHSLKESGDIENDADVVLLMNSSEFDPDQDTVVAVRVGKQREGPSGFDIPLVFRPASQSFQSPDDGR